MKKKRKKKLTPEQEKQVDYFAERMANIMLRQVEEEAVHNAQEKSVDDAAVKDHNLDSFPGPR